MLDRDALHDYQKYSVKFVEDHPAAILIQQMGLGKTISSLIFGTARRPNMKWLIC